MWVCSGVESLTKSLPELPIFREHQCSEGKSPGGLPGLQPLSEVMWMRMEKQYKTNYKDKKSLNEKVGEESTRKKNWEI